MKITVQGEFNICFSHSTENNFCKITLYGYYGNHDSCGKISYFTFRRKKKGRSWVMKIPFTTLKIVLLKNATQCPRPGLEPFVSNIPQTPVDKLHSHISCTPNLATQISEKKIFGKKSKYFTRTAWDRFFKCTFLDFLNVNWCQLMTKVQMCHSNRNSYL